MENGESKRNQIDRYVTDQMDAQERQIFEQRMREHVELAENVHMHRDVLEGIEFHFAKELKQTLIQSDLQKPKSKLKTYLSIAASTVIVVGIGLAYYFTSVPPNSNELFTAYFEPYPNIIAPITRSADGSPYQEVMEQYEGKQYQQAIAGFSRLIEQEPDNQQLKFYRGISYLGLGQAEEASKDFQAVIAASDAQLSTPAYWYLGLSQLGMDSTAQARKTFQQLTNEPGNTGKQAKEILQNLE